MRRRRSVLLAAPALLLAVAVLGPFLVPVPPLAGTVPPEQLAVPAGRFVTVRGVRLHYEVTEPRGEARTDEGDGLVFILLHGFAASTYSWREVSGPLSELGRVVAYDRPAFGLTERPLPGTWSGASPYSPDMQPELLAGLMDSLGIRRAVLVGNSAGGTIATLMALRYPGRVQALILVDPAIYEAGSPAPWLRPLLNTPQLRRLGPLFVRRIQTWGLDFARSAWHDPGKITPEVWDGYTNPLRAANWDRGLWELTAANYPLHLERQLASLRLPVLVITGDDDRIVEPANSRRLARELPDAQLVVIDDCGHLPQEECPLEFMTAVTKFVNARIVPEYAIN